MEDRVDLVREVAGDEEARRMYRESREAKKKEKKAKQMKDRLFLILQKRTERKPPSNLQKLISMVTRRNLKNPYDIREFLSKLGENPSDKTVDYFSLIGKTKVVNGKLTFSDNFANRPITIYLLIKSAATRVFSNDTLFLAGNTKINLPDDVFYKTYKNTIENLVVDGASVVSQPFYANSETKTGYIQDYDADFCSIGLESLTNENERTKILNLQENLKAFTYLGKNYLFSGNQNACVIVSEAKRADCGKLYRAQVRFHLEKKPVSGEKTIKIKGKPRFLDFEAKPDSFCPAYIILPTSVMSYMLVRMHLDYNDLYYILQKQTDLGSIDMFTGMVYWDTFKSYFDLLQIAALLRPTDTENREKAVKKIRKVCTLYEQYKPIVELWAKNQLTLTKILSDFYTSCSSKIKHDKMLELREALFKCIDTRNSLMADESYDSIKSIFSQLGTNAYFINNQFNNEFLKTCDFLLEVLTKIKAGDYDDLEDNVYQAGYAIYQLGMCSDGGFVSMPVIFSTGAFFANVFGDKYAKTSGKTILSQVVNKFVLKEKKAEEKILDSSTARAEVLRNLPTYMNTILENSIKFYTNDLASLINKTKDNASTRMLIQINSNIAANDDTTVQNQLSDLISLKLTSKKDIASLPDTILKSNELKDIVKNQIEKLNKEEDIKDIDSKIKELSKRKDEIKTGAFGPPSTTSKKTMYFAKSLGGRGSRKAKSKLKSTISYTSEPIEEVKEEEPYDKSAYATKSVVGDAWNEGEVFLNNEVMDPISKKRMPNSTMNKWYLTVLDASGIYDNILKDKKLVDLIVKEEDPARLMLNLPLSWKIMDEIVKTTGVPPLGYYYTDLKIPDNYIKNKNIEPVAIENATRLLINDPLDIKQLPVYDTNTIKKFYDDIVNKNLPNLKAYRLLKGLPLNKEIDNTFAKMPDYERKYYEKDESKDENDKLMDERDLEISKENL